LLEEKIGLASEAVGAETIAKAFRRRIAACGLSLEDYTGSMAVYLSYLQHSKEEWENLIESVVVPETWFFRNKASFSYLGGYARFEWLPANISKPGRLLRILSIPCSNGEEPYSIAMTLTDMGLSEEIRKGSFHIDAIDISAKAVRKAKLGIYGRESFRGDDLTFRDRYFDRISDTGGSEADKADFKWGLHSRIKNMVRFQTGNLTDVQLLADEKPYDVIFCRNLLIYLSDAAKQRAIDVIDRLLAQNGILFVGHVERPLICSSTKKIHFVWIRQAGVFACRRAGTGHPAGASGAGAFSRKKLSVPGLAQDRQMSASVFTGRQSGDMSARVRKSVTDFRSVTDTVNAGNLTDNVETRHAVSLQPSDEASSATPLDTARKLADQGYLKESLELCEKYLTEEPFHVQAHFLTGLLYNALNDEERAEEYFNKAVYLDPNHHEALSHLAFIMERRGERNRAGQLQRRAQRILEKIGDD